MDWLTGSVNPFDSVLESKTFEEVIHSVHQQQLLQADQGYAAMRQMHADCVKENSKEGDITLRGVYEKYSKQQAAAIITALKEDDHVQSERPKQKSSVPPPPLTEPLGYE